MTTADNERYECILPQDSHSSDDDVINYPGPSPKSLVEAVFKKKICTVRVRMCFYFLFVCFFKVT